MNVNILLVVFLALLLVLSVFQAMQIASIKSGLQAKLIGTYASSSPTQRSTGSGDSSSSGGPGMVGRC